MIIYLMIVSSFIEKRQRIFESFLRDRSVFILFKDN